MAVRSEQEQHVPVQVDQRGVKMGRSWLDDGVCKPSHTGAGESHSQTCRNMELAFCFCGVATAAFLLTVLWRIKQDSGCWSAASGALVGPLVGALLYFNVPPAVGGGVLLGCSYILICMRRDKMLQGEGRAVLVTGCDSGFGRLLAERLSDLGLKVFAGVLDVNGEGAQQLRERRAQNLQVLQLDVTEAAQIETAHQHISAQVAHTGLWGLVNNAGIFYCPADAELHPIGAYRRSMDVNFMSAVRMCQVFLPLLRRSRGRIVNMSSMAGEVALPLFAAYGASKAALSVFSRALRLELSSWGVRVSLIQPTGFRTKIYGNSEDSARLADEILAAASPEAREDYGEAYISSLPRSRSKMSQDSAEDLSPVVDDMCHALLSACPKPLYTPGRMAWLIPFLQRVVPTAAFDSFILNLIRYPNCKPAALC